MRRFKPILVLACLALAIGCAAWVAQSRQRGPVGLRIVGVTKVGATKTVSVECRWPRRLGVMPAAWKFQYRVSGYWQEPLAWPKFDESGFLVGTNVHVVAFVVPAETEACRYMLNYRVGSRYYCRAYGLLDRSGLLRTFPKACRLMLRWTLQQGAEYEVAPVLKLPAMAHNSKGCTAAERSEASNYALG